MKNTISQLLLAFIALTAISSCSNDFELTEEWKSIPVVYGFLSPKDTATYIRVEKAFLDEASAYTIAQIPDSLYYNDIEVKLQGGGNTFSLIRVDGNLEGYARESGTFATSPNYLYKLVLPTGVNYQPGSKYTLMVNKENGENVTEVETTIVPPVEFRAPFTETWGWTNAEALSTASVRWRYFEPAQIFDILLQFNYTELVNGTQENKSVEFIVAKGIQPNPETTTNILATEIQSVDIFRSIGQNIDATNSGPRYFSDIKIIIDAADGEIVKYNAVGDANTGLTGGGSPPVYSNIKNGYGLFASRNRTVSDRSVVLRNGALDSLKDGRFTKHLNFQ